MKNVSPRLEIIFLLKFYDSHTPGNVVRGNQTVMEILAVAAGHELRFRQLCQQQGK